ncbi:MAG: peptidylprolyl isomerase [Proteobacteria bacterium]|nr:peptidylprolyl isomerase [Pseudomonadota bacterium]
MESSFCRSVFYRKLIAGVAGVFLMMLCQGLWAQEKSTSDDPLLAKNEWVELRKSDYETALMRFPDDVRKRVANDQKAIIKILARLLRDKTLAAQARAEKLDQDPKVKAILASEIERFYAKLRVDKIDQEGNAAFAKDEAIYAARASEIYLANKKRYEVPEQVKASHILIDLKRHSEEEGLKLAREVRAKIVAGEDFGKAAQQYSEDAGTINALGELGWFSYEEMVPEFSEVAFALKKEGDVSEPVLTKFGWHLIRLEGKKEAGLLPFEEAKDRIMAEQKQKFVEDYRNKELEKINDDPKTVLNEEVIDALYIAPPSRQEIEQILKNMKSDGGKDDEKKGGEEKSGKGKSEK